MEIFFHNENVKIEVKEKERIRKWIEDTIKSEGKRGETINIILTSNSKILYLNKKYLKRNYMTDIIAFNYNRENIISGDLYLNPGTIKKNAKKYKTIFAEEINRVIIHGVLHLIGYNDKKEEEKKVMREKENFYLDKF
ncbi:MAG: rRNA maturation RNase YbeY [Bacteroidales bacterium]|nr:rRNA maturation RNase YbeY [Bacteroidales bacterium]